MDKTRPGFRADLQAIAGEVEADVGTILELAKQPRTAEPPPATSTKVAQPSKKTQPVTHRANRRPVATPVHSPQLGERCPPPVLRNITTRLSYETNLLLTEAALRQRLKKAVPATRQDIIEEAVQEWLRHHRYA
jgi:hypothetical protein